MSKWLDSSGFAQRLNATEEERLSRSGFVFLLSRLLLPVAAFLALLIERRRRRRAKSQGQQIRGERRRRRRGVVSL